MIRLSYGRRLQLVRENRQIAKTNAYHLPNGQTVALQFPTAPTVEWDADAPVSLLPVTRQTAYSVAAQTRPLDTISCVLQLRAEGIAGEIIALNFANAKMPGGAYCWGGDAQEECLCGCSLLYESLRRQGAFYRSHWLHPTALYSDRMLYSPAVPVIRASDGNLLPEPVYCSFWTSPAVNRSFAKWTHRNATIQAVMQRRIEKLVQRIASYQPEAVVLGAFGCGVFGNRRSDVLPMFEAAINRWIPDDTTVVFAIP